MTDIKSIIIWAALGMIIWILGYHFPIIRFFILLSVIQFVFIFISYDSAIDRGIGRI